MCLLVLIGYQMSHYLPVRIIVQMYVSLQSLIFYFNNSAKNCLFFTKTTLNWNSHSLEMSKIMYPMQNFFFERTFVHYVLFVFASSLSPFIASLESLHLYKTYYKLHKIAIYDQWLRLIVDLGTPWRTFRYVTKLVK